MLTPSQHDCTGENHGGLPSRPPGGSSPILLPKFSIQLPPLHKQPCLPMSWRVTLTSHRFPRPPVPQHCPPTELLTCPVSTQGTPASAQPVLLGMQPLSSRSAAGMRGGSAAAPAGAPPPGRTRRPFFSRRRLQNAPLVPAVGSGGGSKCQRVGLGYRRTAHGPRAPRAGLPTQPRPSGRQKPLSSPGTAKSLTWEDAQPHRRRAGCTQTRCPSVLPPTSRCPRAQSACLPQATRAGVLGGPTPACPAVPTQTQAGHSTS